MTPFHLPSIRSRVASTAQPGRCAKFRRFMRLSWAFFQWYPNRDYIPEFTVLAKMVPARQLGDQGVEQQYREMRHEGRRIQKIAADRGYGRIDRFRDR